MLKPKSKGLFIDISEFSVLASRTPGFKLPMMVEEIAEMPLQTSQDLGEVRAFLEQLVDFKGGSYFVSRCGVYPEGRFVRYYEAQSASKVKDSRFLTNILQTEFNVDVDSHSTSVLDARDGSDIVYEKTWPRNCFVVPLQLERQMKPIPRSWNGHP